MRLWEAMAILDVNHQQWLHRQAVCSRPTVTIIHPKFIMDGLFYQFQPMVVHAILPLNNTLEHLVALFLPIGVLGPKNRFGVCVSLFFSIGICCKYGFVAVQARQTTDHRQNAEYESWRHPNKQMSAPWRSWTKIFVWFGETPCLFILPFVIAKPPHVL